MDLLHLRIIWAPGAPKITSPLRRFLVASNDLAETGTTFDSLRNPKYANKKIALYTHPYFKVSHLIVILSNMLIVIFALNLGTYLELIDTGFMNNCTFL